MYVLRYDKSAFGVILMIWGVSQVKSHVQGQLWGQLPTIYYDSKKTVWKQIFSF